MSFTLIIWISSIAYGLQTIAGKLTSKYSLQNPWQLNFFWSVFNFLSAIAFVGYFGLSYPQNIIPYVIAGFFLSIGNILLTYSIYKLDITIISPLFAFQTAFTAILGWLFLSETFTSFQYFQIFLIFLCGIFIKLDESFSIKKFSSDLWIGVICMLFLSVSRATFKIANNGGDYWSTIFWVNLFTMLFLLFTIPKFKSSLRSTPLKNYFGALGYSLLGNIGRIFMFIGLSVNATITTVVTSIPTSMLMTIPLAYIFPQLLEKHSTKVYLIRLILAAVMIFCSLKLTLR